jgi:hypothetical protein
MMTVAASSLWSTTRNNTAYGRRWLNAVTEPFWNVRRIGCETRRLNDANVASAAPLA